MKNILMNHMSLLDKEEIQSYLEQAKQASIDSLYLKAKEIVQDYNDQDYNKLVANCH